MPPTESPSETPLTDAAESPFHIIDGVTRDFARSLERKLREAEKDALDNVASRLIDAWCADKGKQIPWAKAVQIVAIVTKQSDAERDRLLSMGDEDGSCGMCGRSAAAPPRQGSEA